MKSIKSVKLIADGMKGANEWLKNAQKKAAELDQFKGELVKITDAKGKSVQGFSKMLNSLSWTIGLPPDIHSTIFLNVTVLSWQSAHTGYVYDAVDIRKTTYKNYLYNV